jgi:hypothetical protein
MCALAAASLVAAPVIVNADAGSAGKHKVHKRGKVCPKGKRYSKKKRRCVVAYRAGKRTAGALPTKSTVTTYNTNPAPPAAPQTYVPSTPPQTAPVQAAAPTPASTVPSTPAGAVGGGGLGVLPAIGATVLGFTAGAVAGSNKKTSTGG